MKKTSLVLEPAALEETLAAIRQRWGANAICKLVPETLSAISTGFPPLDDALAIGGIARGRITELQGTPTSGMTTLALKVAQSAQAAGELVAFINLGYRLDPAYVRYCGVELSTLLLVLPKTDKQALDIMTDIVASRGVGLIVFNCRFCE